MELQQHSDNPNRAHIRGVVQRALVFERDLVNVEARTVELSFSSEAPVSRDWGLEILDHAPTSVRLGRLNDGGAVLVGHNIDDHVGVVERAYIGPDRKGRAVLRFGQSQRAAEVFQDIVDGIRRNVSVAYQIHDMILEKEIENAVGEYRAMDWEPMEISIVSIPADATVGVGRAAALPKPSEGVPETLVVESETVLTPTVVTVSIVPKETKIMDKALDVDTTHGEERRRVSEILALGKQHQAMEMATHCVNEGRSVDAFKGMLLEERYAARPVETMNPSLGLSDKEAQSFSFVRAIHAMSTRDFKAAGFELECSNAVAQRLGKSPKGMYIPIDVQRRDLTKGTNSAGGFAVGTDMLGGSFIELLSNAMVVKQLGATVLGGLVGDVAIPSQTAGSTAYWVSENAAITESAQTFGQATLSPKTCGAFTDISRKLINQASIDVEALVRLDLARSLALAMDVAAIHGTGSSGQPTGIVATSGIGDVAGGTNGAAPTWSHMLELESDVAVANAAVGALAYLSNAKVRGKLKATPKVASTDSNMIWSDINNLVNGYPMYTSNQVSSTLTKGTSSVASAIIFGNWNDLLIGEWAGLDLLVDPYTGITAGTIRVRAMQDVDIAIRHAASFSCMLDALTA